MTTQQVDATNRADSTATEQSAANPRAPFCYQDNYGQIDGDDQGTLEFLTRTPSRVISERLEKIGVKQNALDRIQQLNQVLDDMAVDTESKKTTVERLKEYQAVKTKLDGFISEFQKVVSASSSLEKDLNYALDMKRQWKGRVKKARQAAIEAEKQNQLRRTGEFRNLEELAQKSRARFKERYDDIKGDMDMLNDIVHDYNMIKARLVSLIANSSTYMRKEPESAQEFANELNELGRTVNQIEVLEAKRKAQSKKNAETSTTKFDLEAKSISELK